jgi:uncharacterized protein (TIGR02147 family)
MNAHAFTDYRRFLRDLIEAKKRSDPQVTCGRLADRAGVQRTYLSRVLHGRGSLSGDQLYLIARELQVPEKEREYLQLLLETERCQVPERREKLLKRRDQARKEALRSEEFLGREGLVPSESAFAEYYGNSLCPIVHMFLTIPAYLKEPRRIALDLGISHDALTAALNVLERCRVLQLEKQGFRMLKPDLHLSARSHLSRTYATQFRLKAIEYQQRFGNEDDYFFTSSFSGNEKLRTEIKARFLELLRWISAQVEKGSPEKVYHINFDLFRF